MEETFLHSEGLEAGMARGDKACYVHKNKQI